MLEEDADNLEHLANFCIKDRSSSGIKFARFAMVNFKKLTSQIERTPNCDRLAIRGTMRRILLNPWGSLGDLHPFLALAQALREQGAEVTIATMRDYAQRVKDLGFSFVAFGPHFKPDDPLICASLSDPKTGTKRLLSEVVLPAVEDSCREIEASVASHDVVVTCGAGIATQIACELHQKPWVGTALAPVAFFSRYDPPILPISLFLSRLARVSQFAGHLLRETIKRMTLQLMTGVAAFRSNLGLKQSSQNLLIDGYSPYLNLAMFDAVFGLPQRDWPPFTIQTGACLFEQERVLTVEQRLQLEDFLNLGEPPVVLTLGSSAVNSPQNFFADCHAAIDALGLRCISVVGSNLVDQSTLDPKRFLQLTYAPYGPLFGASQAIVSHGGIGTLSQILRAGKPTLVVPFAHDQPDNAARIERIGVGLSIPLKRLNTNRVQTVMTRLMSIKRFSTRAVEISRNLPSNGASVAATAILQLANALPVQVQT